MIDEILTEALGADKYRPNRFPNPPAGTFAVTMDDIETDGPDGQPPVIFHHGVTIELYAPKPDPTAEAALEASMSARGLHWTKEDRFWIASEKLYQTIYEFDYTEKRRT